jgi:acetate kinase
MGFTPLEGLIMGTRCGDIDAAILPFLMEKEGLDAKGLSDLMNKKSGVYGMTGISSDFRDIEDGAAAGNELAQVALVAYVQKVKKYIGSYVAEMNGVDAVVFTAGVGENGVGIRADISSNMEFLGMKIDEDANKVRGKERVISTEDSKVKILLIPTNEELVIARDTLSLVK